MTDMASVFVAQTTLLLDKNGGKETVSIPEGKQVRKSDYDEAVWDRWIEGGSVTEVAQVTAEDDSKVDELEEKNSELEAKVAELQKQLAEAKKPAGTTPAPQK